MTKPIVDKVIAIDSVCKYCFVSSLVINDCVININYIKNISKRTAHNFVLVLMVLKLAQGGGGGGGVRFGQKHCFHFESHLQNLITRRLCC